MEWLKNPKTLLLVAFSWAWISGPSNAQVVNLKESIGNCGCEDGCFTDEVTNLKCTGDSIQFNSRGLPDPSHVLMRGITATNQQYPRAHAYEINVSTDGHLSRSPTPTDPGPIGIAVNGVPLFDPGTQGPIDHGTGKPPHTLDKGELDECGGHAGRGDDYHYHIAPKCLIRELGEKRIEQQRKPIGFANDGFPILALGWFDRTRSVEKLLDKCRGIKDANGNYFYNIKATPKWDILNCYMGRIQRISRDRWKARHDRTDAEIVGAKANFHISRYHTLNTGSELCHIMEGTLVDQRVIDGQGDMRRIASQDGAIFYCSPRCYAEFFEPEPRQKYRGPILFYDLVTESCPASFNPDSLALFEPYNGPALKRKRAGGGKKKRRKKPPPPR